MRKMVFAVSGVKNSGKTTLISDFIRYFKKKGLSVSVIKHDGHDFEPDVPDTDSYKLRSAGAQGVAVFSERRMMVIREGGGIDEKDLMKAFPDSDIILLEGFKYSSYPKVEVVRRENSCAPVCDPGTLFAIVTDYLPGELPEPYRSVSLYQPGEGERLAEDLYRRGKRENLDDTCYPPMGS